MSIEVKLFPPLNEIMSDRLTDGHMGKLRFENEALGSKTYMLHIKDGFLRTEGRTCRDTDTHRRTCKELDLQKEEKSKIIQSCIGVSSEQNFTFV